jgi:hypothetical protein
MVGTIMQPTFIQKYLFQLKRILAFKGVLNKTLLKELRCGYGNCSKCNHKHSQIPKT